MIIFLMKIYFFIFSGKQTVKVNNFINSVHDLTHIIFSFLQAHLNAVYLLIAYSMTKLKSTKVGINPT